MKRFIAIATALLLYASAAFAQGQGDKPAETQPPSVTIVTGNENKHAREADARRCLDLKDNNAIARCTERYRHRGGGGGGGRGGVVGF